MTDRSDELNRTLNDLRNRVLAGETIPPEEYSRIIADIRQERIAAASRPPSPKKKTTRINPDTLTPL